MKRYYMNGICQDGGLVESFEKIIDAKSEKEAVSILRKGNLGANLTIENCYETSWDATL